MSQSLSEHGILAPTTTTVTVTTAGTRVQITTNTSARVQAFCLQNPSTNSGVIYYGDSSVSSTNGIELFPGDKEYFNCENTKFGVRVYRPSDIYIDTNVSGSIARIVFFSEASS